MAVFPVGVEVVPAGVRANNGAFIEVGITKTDAAGVFTVVTRNPSVGSATFTIRIPGQADLSGSIPAGTTIWPTDPRQITEDTAVDMQGS